MWRESKRPSTTHSRCTSISVDVTACAGLLNNLGCVTIYGLANSAKRASNVGVQGGRIIVTNVIDTAPATFSPKLARATGKLTRKLVAAPLVRKWFEYRYRSEIARHVHSLPKLTPDGRRILEELRRNSTAVRDAHPFIPIDVLDAADECVSTLAKLQSPKGSLRLAPDDVASNLDLYKWGLEDELLNLVENYLGLPPHYLGVDVKRELADGRGCDVRQWHKDVEDRRMLKIIIYLNDVDSLGGPFEYIDAQSSSEAAQALRYFSGFVSDDAMRQVIPSDKWQNFTGSRLSAVFVDTSQVFHRVRPPIRTDRYSMTFSYSSRRPYQVFPEYTLKRSTFRRLQPELTPRQWRVSKPLLLVRVFRAVGVTA